MNVFKKTCRPPVVPGERFVYSHHETMPQRVDFDRTITDLCLSAQIKGRPKPRCIHSVYFKGDWWCPPGKGQELGLRDCWTMLTRWT